MVMHSIVLILRIRNYAAFLWKGYTWNFCLLLPGLSQPSHSKNNGKFIILLIPKLYFRKLTWQLPGGSTRHHEVEDINYLTVPQ